MLSILYKSIIDIAFYSLQKEEFFNNFLCQVLTILKERIRDEGLFDVANPAVIHCDKELEAALGLPTINVTQIR